MIDESVRRKKDLLISAQPRVEVAEGAMEIRVEKPSTLPSNFAGCTGLIPERVVSLEEARQQLLTALNIPEGAMPVK